MRDFEQAIKTGQRAVDIDPKQFSSRAYLAWAYEGTRDFEKAIDTYEAAGLDMALARKGLREGGEKGYWEGRIQQELKSPRGPNPHWLAVSHAELQDTEGALRWLRRAVEERNGWMVYLNVDPAYDSLRSDPRFQQLVEQVGLPTTGRQDQVRQR
jgi:tetratricopeptide (TPR) repeat protein